MPLFQWMECVRVLPRRCHDDRVRNDRPNLSAVLLFMRIYGDFVTDDGFKCGVIAAYFDREQECTSMEASVKLPSNRRFGLTFCVVFLALGAFAAIKGHAAASYAPLLAIGVVFGGIAFTVPGILAPLNRLWFKFGELLGRIVSPLVLGIIYFGLLVPIAFIARLLGRDELHLKRRSVASYWISRNPPGPTGQSFTHQF